MTAKIVDRDSAISSAHSFKVLIPWDAVHLAQVTCLSVNPLVSSRLNRD